MVKIGYTLNSEQTGPVEMVDYGVMAEDAGFDSLQVSDHYSPWLEVQGHAPNAWVVMGAVARATSSIPIDSFVTCPTIRYNPVVVAQQAATMQILSGGRFRLGLGSGENLNEHVVGEGWPHVGERHAMLREATGIIRRLLDGETIEHRGEFYSAAAAKLWDLPCTPPPVGIAASGPESAKIAGELGDFLVSVDAKRSIVEDFVAAGGAGKPRTAQVLICWDEDKEAALQRAHEQAPWLLLGWGGITALATPAEFKAATASITAEEVAAVVPCGPEAGPIAAAVQKFVDAGFDQVSLFQVGGQSQPAFIRWAQDELLPVLRELTPVPF